MNETEVPPTKMLVDEVINIVISGEVWKRKLRDGITNKDVLDSCLPLSSSKVEIESQSLRDQ